MTIIDDLKEDSFTLVTSQRKNRRKQNKVKSITTQIVNSHQEEDLDEDFVIK